MKARVVLAAAVIMSILLEHVRSRRQHQMRSLVKLVVCTRYRLNFHDQITAIQAISPVALRTALV